jgi:hypothetical protein
MVAGVERGSTFDRFTASDLKYILISYSMQDNELYTFDIS